MKLEEVDSAQNVYPGELKAGEVLDRRFEVVELAARGGMAAVYRARDRAAGGFVALKVPHLRYESDPAMFNRFRREDEIVRNLDHPYLLRLQACEHPKSRPYLVMEFLEGKTLDRVMASRRPMPEAEALRIAGQICDALEYLRLNGIVHRDLKPDNIMVCADGTIRLFDFGISALLRQRRLTFAGIGPTLGTPDYVSPEQVKGRIGDHRSDLYSLGAILYEMLTGRVPFEGDDTSVVMQSRIAGDPPAPRSVNPELSPEIEEIILHAMAREPADRHGNAAQLKRELENPRSVEVTGRASRLRPIRIRFWHSNPWILRGLGYAALSIAVELLLFGVAYAFFIHRAAR